MQVTQNEDQESDSAKNGTRGSIFGYLPSTSRHVCEWKLRITKLTGPIFVAISHNPFSVSSYGSNRCSTHAGSWSPFSGLCHHHH